MKNLNKKAGYRIEDPNNTGEIIVSWIITHACPERCGYCISPEKTDELSFNELLLIQGKLIKGGVTKMRYIGGEPLLIPDLPKLVADAYKKGLNTRLSTNGILLTEDKFKELSPFLNSIALPFESLNDDINEKVRGSRLHREVVSSKISMIKKAGGIGILINTCVHRENIDELDKLGEFLNEQRIDHWKLRLFSSESGRGAVPNKKRFEITEEEFLEKVAFLQNKYKNIKIDGRLPSKLASRLLVSPQGDLYRMIGSEDNNINYGNILRENLNIGEISRRDNCT